MASTDELGLSSPISALAATALCITFIGVARKIYRLGQREPHLPPGPPTLPVLGNLVILPLKDAHIKFAEWAQQYGDIYSLKVASGTIVVLTSFDAVYQIMEKNGAITADRSKQTAPLRIFGDRGAIALLQYGPHLRSLRKVANEMLSPRACENHMPVILSEVSQMMSDLLNRPQDFMKDIQQAIISLSYSIICGIRTPTLNSPEIESFLRTNEGFFELASPGGAPPVDLMPILNYIPDRFVNNWKARCDAVREEQEGLWYNLLDEVEKRIRDGENNECFMETLVTRAEEWNLDREIISTMSGNLVIGAAHTTTSTLQWFVLLAAINQEAQSKLRDEIDRVVGPDRAPGEEDLPNLPYLRAFVREVLRLRPVAPLAIPHLANEDQLYQGYLIPKNATIIFNVWAILHDPRIFENPEMFNPDRFMNVDPSKTDLMKNIESLPFGVGRRVCPGMFLANRVVQIFAASLVWGFELSAPQEGGLDHNKMKVHLTCEPIPFKCDIKPRSLAKTKIIEENLLLSQSVFEKYTRGS